ncbi:aspartyl-phosphate phosphatase Spo0E family protein [Neobacillus niacini]
MERLREEMVTTGLSEGLSSEQTIKISQKLDHYIAIYLYKSHLNDFSI